MLLEFRCAGGLGSVLGQSRTGTAREKQPLELIELLETEPRQYECDSLPASTA